MYYTTSSIYRELATALVEAVGYREFFNGSVVVMDGEVECRLVCTVVIVHGTTIPTTIEKIIPVWWEMRTTDGSGPIDNDFSFGEMMESLPRE